MNRKNLTAAVLAGLAGAAGIVGSAQAVNINPDGLGQVLIYPYYTTNGGNQTILSVVNTTDAAKAVKVRFKEGKNSREVLDFNLYLSAWDVWTAAIADNAGTPTLYVNDNSCTVPYLFGNGGMQEFLVFGMNDVADPEGFGDISRATEGYFEMIEMGAITDGSATQISATHVAGEMTTCGNLVDAWTIGDTLDNTQDGYWIVNPDTDLETPTGGLFGGAAIVDVPNGTMFSYDAKAINGYSEDDGFVTGVLHGPPGDSFPSLNSGNVLNATVFSDSGDVLPSADFARGVDAISYVFMHDAIMNEYTTEDDIAAATEWVVTFPTKSFYVYKDESSSDLAVAPFESVWDRATEQACEPVLLDTIYDRNERTLITETPTGEPIPPIVSPRPPGVEIPVEPFVPFELCYEVSVIEFGVGVTIPGATSSILGSSNFHTIDNTALGFENGWARIDMMDFLTDSNDDGVPEDQQRVELGGLTGLPVTGFAMQRFTNGFLGGGNTILANYGGIFQHKATRGLGSLGGQR